MYVCTNTGVRVWLCVCVQVDRTRLVPGHTNMYTVISRELDQQVTMCATTHVYVHLEACMVSLQLHICSAIEAQSIQRRYKHTQTQTQTQVQLLFSLAQAPAMQLDDDCFYEYSLSRLQWPFQSSKPKLKA